MPVGGRGEEGVLRVLAFVREWMLLGPKVPRPFLTSSSDPTTQHGVPQGPLTHWLTRNDMTAKS